MDNNVNIIDNHSKINPVLASSVASKLREMFLNGDLKPGEHIIESEIADRLNVSRGPVRDAMKILKDENIVEIIPHRGTFVTKLTIDDIKDLYSLRGVLEGLGARLIAEKGDPIAIQQLEVCMQQLYASKHNLSEFAKHDIEFHELLCKLSGNQWLYKQWLSLKIHIWLFIRATQVLDAPGYQGMVDYHSEIFKAIKAGIPGLSERSACDHSKIGVDQIMLLWTKHSDTLLIPTQINQIANLE
jgi:DNA-binding GntR family transcriptional regulator